MNDFKVTRPTHRPVEMPDSSKTKESQPGPSGGRDRPALQVDFSGRGQVGRTVTDPGCDSRPTGAFQPPNADAARVAGRLNLSGLTCADELDGDTAGHLRGMIAGIEDPVQRERAVDALDAWTALF